MHSIVQNLDNISTIIRVVPRVRVELTTPASSGLRSTDELPRLNVPFLNAA